MHSLHNCYIQSVLAFQVPENLRDVYLQALVNKNVTGAYLIMFVYWSLLTTALAWQSNCIGL